MCDIGLHADAACQVLEVVGVSARKKGNGEDSEEQPAVVASACTLFDVSSPMLFFGNSASLISRVFPVAHMEGICLREYAVLGSLLG